MKENTFVKTHGLGNEYIVLDSDNISFQLTEKAIKRICNVNFGRGSDGILLKVPSDKADFGLRIYNHRPRKHSTKADSYYDNHWPDIYRNYWYVYDRKRYL